MKLDKIIDADYFEYLLLRHVHRLTSKDQDFIVNMLDLCKAKKHITQRQMHYYQGVMRSINEHEKTKLKLERKQK